MCRLEVKDLMETELSYLPPMATVGEIVDMLRSSGHQSFPLVSERRAVGEVSSCYALRGVISRRALLSVIEYREELVLGLEVSHDGSHFSLSVRLELVPRGQHVMLCGDSRLCFDELVSSLLVRRLTWP